MDGTDKKGVTNFHVFLLINTRYHTDFFCVKIFSLETFDLKNEINTTENNLYSKKNQIMLEVTTVVLLSKLYKQI